MADEVAHEGTRSAFGGRVAKEIPPRIRLDRHRDKFQPALDSGSRAEHGELVFAQLPVDGRRSCIEKLVGAYLACSGCEVTDTNDGFNTSVGKPIEIEPPQHIRAHEGVADTGELGPEFSDGTAAFGLASGLGIRKGGFEDQQVSVQGIVLARAPGKYHAVLTAVGTVVGHQVHSIHQGDGLVEALG